ncbi:MAG: protein kinase [Gemmataceae bacterium]
MQREVEQRDPIDVLAGEFTHRLRQGKNPSIAEYQRQHPELAAQIGELFPTIAMLEEMKRKKEQPAQPEIPLLGSARPERLGDLQILREIGRGGMGIVYEAKQLSLGRHVAVKVLPPQTVKDTQHLRRFQQEARTVATLHHNNIVPVFGVGEHQGTHYIVMQLIRGVGLDEVFSELRKLSGKSENHSTNSSVRGAFVSTIAQGLLEGSLDRNGLQLGQKNTTEQIGRRISRGVQTRIIGNPQQINRSDSQRTEPITAGSRRQATPPGDDQQTLEVIPRGVGDLGVEVDVVSAPLRPQRSLRDIQDRSCYWRNVARIGMQVAEALDYAHRHQVLHRDIKPGNLLIDGKGEVWVADFGVAKSLTADDLSQTGEVVGTLRYMSPEQLNGKVQSKSDVYSLGVTLYELLTLENAYEGQNQSDLVQRILTNDLPPPRQRDRAIPRDLETIVLKACAREPSQRYDTAGDLAADLKRYLEDRPILARRITVLESALRWTRRNPVVAGLTGMIFVLLTVIAVVSSIAYAQTTNALEKEREERFKTEKVLRIALEAFDEVYQRSTPRDLMDGPQFTVTGVDGQLVSVGSQPVPSEQSAALLEELLKFYDELAIIQTNNVVLREHSARASFRIGHIYRSLGQSEKALLAYATALSKYDKLSSGLWATGNYAKTMIRLFAARATVYQSRGEKAEAATEFQSALTLVNNRSFLLSRRDIAYEKARVYYLMGRRSAQRPDLPPPGPQKRDRKHGPFGRHEPHHWKGPGRKGKGGKGPSRGPLEILLPSLFGAPSPKLPPQEREQLVDQTKDLQRAVTLLNGVLKRNSDDRECRYLLGLCYQELAGVQRLLHNHRDANNELNRSIDILEKLTRDHKQVNEYRYALSQSYVMVDVGPPPHQRGSLTIRARQSFEKALGILDQLSADNPGHPDYVVSQVQAYRRLGDLLCQFDEEGTSKESEKRAKSYLVKAVNLQKELVRRYPKVTSYKLGLVMAELSLAKLLLKTRRGREAKPVLEDSVKLVQELQRTNPDADYLQKMLDLSQDALDKLDWFPPPPPPRDRDDRRPGKGRGGPRKGR